MKKKSNVNKVVELTLCVFLGYLGAHRFYAKKTKTAYVYLFTLGYFGFGWIFDIIALTLQFVQTRRHDQSASRTSPNTLQKAKPCHPIDPKKQKVPTQSIIPSNYIVFDIETTGFSKTDDRIIEIAATEYVDNTPVNTFHRYVNPQRRIPNSITRLTGIHNSDVSKAPTITEAKSDILRFFGSATLVGHNIKTFDIPFLEAQLNHHFSNPRIDTLALAKDVFPGLPNYKLASLDRILGLGGLEHHRAGNDIAMNNALLMACCNPKQYEHRINDPAILNSLVTEKRDIYAKPDIHGFSPTDPTAVPNTMLTGKCIVFSGELNILPEEAYQIAVDAGAILKTAISKKVDYLVQGYVEPQFLDENGWSNKRRTAHKLIDSGEGKVKIINEEEFMYMAVHAPSN